MACKGLQHAHDKGVVHRDIKPENMMVVKRRSGEHLVIVDFGIATSSGSSGGRVCGTPYTMAPEQIEGKPVDARTDVYALGCCAFQMLTGKPFAQGATLTATLALHLSNERAAIDPATGVPKAIASVVHRCLALDPADRYASATELEAALCEAQIAAGIGEVGVHLAPPEVDEPRRARISTALARPRRKPRLVPAGLAGVAGGVMMSLVGGWIAQAPEREPAPIEIVASEPQMLAASDVVVAMAEDAPEHAATSAASAFSFATLSERAALDEVAPEPTQEAKPRPRTRRHKTAAASSGAPPSPEPTRASLFGFREDEDSSWRTRSRARKLVREGDRARRHGEVARASDLYRRASKLGSRRADHRLEDLGKTKAS